MVRTSGYANFANDTIATGNGTITGILTRYSGLNILVRDINEVNMDGDRYSGGSGGGGGSGNYILNKDFRIIRFGGWILVRYKSQYW